MLTEKILIKDSAGLQAETSPGLFPTILGKGPWPKLGKMIDLTSKLGEINDIEHNKGSKIYLQNQVILDCIMPCIQVFSIILIWVIVSHKKWSLKIVKKKQMFFFLLFLFGKTDMVLGKMWLFSIGKWGRNFEIWPLQKGRKLPEVSKFHLIGFGCFSPEMDEIRFCFYDKGLAMLLALEYSILLFKSVTKSQRQ